MKNIDAVSYIPIGLASRYIHVGLCPSCSHIHTRAYTQTQALSPGFADQRADGAIVDAAIRLVLLQETSKHRLG